MTSRPVAPGVVAVRIVVSKIGIDLPIVEGDGMVAPIGRAAHFPGTAWPDAGSNTYLYGHAQDGMFLRLWDIQRGDQIVLTLVNGQKRCFAVDRIVAKAAWNDTSLLLPTDHEQLTLQTSTSYTPTAPRFVAIALPCA
jgi:LPXTG-site transpeptidase (sortase) family protein